MAGASVCSGHGGFGGTVVVVEGGVGLVNVGGKAVVVVAGGAVVVVGLFGRVATIGLRWGEPATARGTAIAAASATAAPTAAMAVP